MKLQQINGKGDNRSLNELMFRSDLLETLISNTWIVSYRSSKDEINNDKCTFVISMSFPSIRVM